MKTLLDNYDWRQIHLKKTTGNNEDAAYSANDSKRPTATCTNCKKKGHTKKQCWRERGAKAEQAPKWYLKKKKEKETEKATTAASTATQPSTDTKLDGV